MVVFEGFISQPGATFMLSSVTVGAMVLVDMTTSRVWSQCCFFEEVGTDSQKSIVE